MRSKFLRFGANAFTRGFFTHQRNLPRATFFRPELRAAQFHSIVTNEEWIFNTHSFPKTSFRGKRVNNFENSFPDALLANPNIKWRSMSEEELDESTNKNLFGLMGQRLNRTHPDGEESKELGQDGEAKAVSLSNNFFKRFKFANFAFDQEQLQLAVDLHNIPKNELLKNYLQQLSNGYTSDYPQKDVSLSAVHVSSILMRVLRDKFTFKIEYNPLYVDQNLLSKELKDEYASLLEKFYNSVPLARVDSECFEIQEFQVQQRSFYKRYGEEAGLCEEQMKAIESELNSSVANLEEVSRINFKI